MKHYNSFVLSFSLICTTTFAHAQTEIEPTPSPTPVAAATPVVITKSTTDKIADFASGPGTLAFVGSSVAVPLFNGDNYNTQRSLRAADAVITSVLITEGLKRLVREKRPDSDERDSFPSGHATAAFAAATMLSQYQPKQKLLWYGSASLIAWSRVKKKRHYWHDVVAGAAVGHYTAKIELRQSRGLILRPFIKTRRDENINDQKMGFSLGGSF
jgi:hypothetical protein